VRILAVGWENLASLAEGVAPDENGERLLRLDRPPLSQVGVFAITGPTGAGKTTILDAICLALFDATPRLTGGQAVRVGRSVEEAEIAASDVRNLLRRGAGEGCAICVFEGRDGVAYRATWSVRRARKSPSGRLQYAEMELREEAGGAPIGRTKSEVLAAIRDRLGLDFDQFRRSVLLAQGEFAAFLAARGSERADLLEKVTGTGLYARLGREAYERAGREEAALAALQRQLGDLGGLGDDARAELAARVGWLRWRAAQAEFALAEANETLRRDAELRRLGRRLAEAQGAVAKAEAEHAAAEDRRALMQRLARVKEHAGGLVALDEAVRSEAAGREALAAAMARREAAGAARDRALSVWLRSASAAAEVATASARRAEAALASAVAEEAEAQARVAERAADVGLAGSWADVRPRLVAAVEAARREAKAGAEREALLAATEAAAERLRVAEAALAEGAARAEEASAAEEAARSALGEDARPAAERAVAEAERQERRLARLAELRSEATQRRAERRRWETEAEGHLEAAAAASEEAAAAAAEEATARAGIPALEQALERARATVELAQHRDVLVDGEPCPLCGATEHPFAHEQPVVDAVLAGLQEQVAGARSAAQSAGQARVQAEARGGASREAGERARGRAAEQALALAGVEERWEEAAAGLGVAMDLEDDAPMIEAAERLAAVTAEARAGLETVRAREATREAAAAEARAARLAADGLRGARDAAQAGVGAAQAAEQAFAARRAEDAATLAAASALVDVEGMKEAPEAWLDAVAARVRAARAAEDRARSASAAVEAARSALAEARTAAALASARREDVAARVPSNLPPEDEVLPADEAGRRAEEAVAAASAAGDAAREAAALVDERAALAAGRREAVDAAVAVLGTDEAGLRSEVARLGELPALEEALAALGRRHAQAKSVAEDRARHLADEEAKGRRQLTPGEAREAMELLGGLGDDDESVAAVRVRAEGAVRRVHEELGRAGEVLARDDEARARGAELSAAVRRQEGVCAVWGTMRELIGDAQGKGYRAFAQSLTLDLLLEEANRHLDELEPRYRLERAPPVNERALLELQVVDRDMGDEVRPTSSLSGGEGFLVSLALALALSSLSADGSTVGSLFIDEGFGTLDEKTLETALSVLEALQAGGRQVGIISHVQKLAENIGAQVIVQPEAPGRSRVSVAGPGYS